MKRIVFCFDGTWNKIDGDYPTNVARIAQSVSRFDKLGQAQIIHYDEGVGTTRAERLTGGIFGRGLIENIIEAYHFLVLNHEPGDKIYVFGFSRGAFTARSFIGLIRNCGIISRRSLNHIRAAVDLYTSRAADASPHSERARQFRFKHCPTLCLPGDLDWRREAYPDSDAAGLKTLEIDYLGVWDTVGALGIPSHLKLLGFLNRKYRFHDTTLSGFVKRARHAVAADERRRAFEPSLWTNLDDLNAAAPEARLYQQQVFPGVHSAVGGGGPVRGLSDAALEWVFKGARKQGLEFDLDDQSPIHTLRPDHRAQLFNETGKTRWTWRDRMTGTGLKDRSFEQSDRTGLHKAIARRYATPPELLPEQAPYRPASLRSFWPAIEEMVEASKGELDQDLQIVESAGDRRALQAPTSVRDYLVKAGDSLKSIAAREMSGPADAGLLSLHNRNVGLLFEDGELYTGSRIEIPAYPTMPRTGVDALEKAPDPTPDLGAVAENAAPPA
jgi:uncharacterized protein (DUF2235 family)